MRKSFHFPWESYSSINTFLLSNPWALLFTVFSAPDLNPSAPPWKAAPGLLFISKMHLHFNAFNACHVLGAHYLTTISRNMMKCQGSKTQQLFQERKKQKSLE